MTSSFVTFGVNYHPSRAGCRWWTEWDEQQIRADFHAMAATGLNAVRLFLFWRDFMPTEHGVDPEVLARLELTAIAAEQAGLTCVLSLLTIWMNGQLLDLPWRTGRDIWRDPGMLAAETRYVRAIAKTLRPRSNILAYDLGDELWNIDPQAARSLSREHVARWQEALADAIRGESPGARVMQANDASAVFGTGPYGVDNQRQLDLIGVHGFPQWTPVAIGSTLCYEATNLPSFLARTAAAYGRPVIDELGSYGVGGETSAAFLRCATASLVANGTSGVFVWSWQDIASTAEPYADRPAERFTGLRTTTGAPKKTLTEYRRIIDGDLMVERQRPSAALYLPRALRGQGSSYLDTDGGAVPAFYGYLLLKRAHIAFDVVTDATAEHELLVCPSPAHLTADDIESLREHAERGATVYLSLGDYLHGLPDAGLIGAEVVDYAVTDPGKSSLLWDGTCWPLRWNSGTPFTTMAVSTSETVATYPDESPALVRHRVGKGQVLFTNAPVERQFEDPDWLCASHWHTFYRRVARFSGLRPTVTADTPDLEVVVGRGRSVVINHKRVPVTTKVVIDTAEYKISVGAKDWLIVRENADGVS